MFQNAFLDSPPGTGAANLTIDTTGITGGGANRLLFESGTNKVSNDGDLTFNPTLGVLSIHPDDAGNLGSITVGRTRIDNRLGDVMTLSHFDRGSNADYALAQNALGLTIVNATTQGIRFAIAGTSLWELNSSGHIVVLSGSRDIGTSTTGKPRAIYTTGVVNIGGDLDHDGANVGFYGAAPTTKQSVSGSRGGNAALASLLTALATIGLITDGSSA